MTDRERVEFACEVMRLDVDAMTKRDRMRWESRLAEFFAGETRSGVVGRPVEWEGRSAREERLDYPQDWRNLRTFSAAVLHAALGDAAPPVKLEYGQEFHRPGVLIVRSSITTTFTRILTGALMAEGLTRLAACAACREAFVRGRADQRFCDGAECESKRQAGYFARWAATHDRKRRRVTPAPKRIATKRASRS